MGAICHFLLGILREKAVLDDDVANPRRLDEAPKPTPVGIIPNVQVVFAIGTAHEGLGIEAIWADKPRVRPQPHLVDPRCFEGIQDWDEVAGVAVGAQGPGTSIHEALHVHPDHVEPLTPIAQPPPVSLESRRELFAPPAHLTDEANPASTRLTGGVDWLVVATCDNQQCDYDCQPIPHGHTPEITCP
ncbi:hypothetical protein ACFL3A_00225 [Pseudomonadota bacterium]